MTNSRSKGKRGELEVAKFLSSIGIKAARRGQQFSGVEGKDVVGVPGVHIEVKRTERFNVYTATAQAERDAAEGEIPSVWHRRNRSKLYVTVAADELLELSDRLRRAQSTLVEGEVDD